MVLTLVNREDKSDTFTVDLLTGGMDKLRANKALSYSPWCQHKDGDSTLSFADMQSCNQIKTWVESSSTTGVPSMSQSSGSTK